jgi:hypothetical protein
MREATWSHIATEMNILPKRHYQLLASERENVDPVQQANVSNKGFSIPVLVHKSFVIQKIMPRCFHKFSSREAPHIQSGSHMLVSHGYHGYLLGLKQSTGIKKIGDPEKPALVLSRGKKKNATRRPLRKSRIETHSFRNGLALLLSPFGFFAVCIFYT